MKANITTALQRHRSKKGIATIIAHFFVKDPGIPVIYELYGKVKQPIIVWGSVKNINRKARSNNCKLCLTEKHITLLALGNNRLINKKSKFICKCQHQNKSLLSNVKNCKDYDLEKKRFVYFDTFNVCYTYFVFLLGT